MRSTTRILALVSTAAIFVGAALPDFAAEAPAAPAGEHPERGMRMSAVEARYGAPATRYPAVGQPPISRWDYPGFVVYFENDRVLHAVILSGTG